MSQPAGNFPPGFPVVLSLVYQFIINVLSIIRAEAVDALDLDPQLVSRRAGAL